MNRRNFLALSLAAPIAIASRPQKRLRQSICRTYTLGFESTPGVLPSGNKIVYHSDYPNIRKGVVALRDYTLSAKEIAHLAKA